MSVLQFRAITPQQYNVGAFQKELRVAAGQIGSGMLKDFEKTTNGWETDVQFTVEISITTGGVFVLVGTDNKIYGYVDKGTRPHTITPTKASVLRFTTGYKAATSPGRLSSKAPRRTGDAVFSKRVNHPGTEPRRFSLQIKRRWDSRAPRIWQRAINRAARAGG